MQRPHGRRSQIVVAATIGLVASMAATGPASAARLPRSSRSRPRPRTSCCLPPMGSAKTSSSATRPTAGFPASPTSSARRCCQRWRHAHPSPAEHRLGWYTMATGAWPGVHGSTNNTFHINSQTRQPRCLRPGVLSAETIAQAAERGKRVVRWSGPAAVTAPSPVPPSISGHSCPAAA